MTENDRNNFNGKNTTEDNLASVGSDGIEMPINGTASANRILIASELITIPRSTRNPISIAKRRWKILAKALCNRANRSRETTAKAIDRLATDEYLASVRRFTSFDLFERIPYVSTTDDDAADNEGAWIVYRLCDIAQNVEYKAIVRYVNRTLTPDDLMGFNNTGNICVWPSEEALAYYCIAKMDLFRGKRVLELGGGMTCLAGLLVAKYAATECVHLTDGNCVSVDNVRHTLKSNGLSEDGSVCCSVLKWENALGDNNNNDTFDYILSADCLFFDNSRCALVNALWHLLKSDGCAIVTAPHRGKTLDSFVKQAKAKGFMCRASARYDDVIWCKHLRLKETPFYDENIHYPILIELTKATQ